MSNTPTETDHNTQALSNLQLVPLLPAAQYDWHITVLFYECVHHLGTVCAIYGLPTSHNHAERFKVLRGNPVFRTIVNAYQNLYALSIVSRYEAYPVADLDTDARKAEGYATQIRDFCRVEVRKQGLSIP